MKWGYLNSSLTLLSVSSSKWRLILSRRLRLVAQRDQCVPDVGGVLAAGLLRYTECALKGVSPNASIPGRCRI